MSTAIFVYAATAPVNGYSGGSLYARMGGKNWIRQMVVSAFLLPALVCGTAFFINFIAISCSVNIALSDFNFNLNNSNTFNLHLTST